VAKSALNLKGGFTAARSQFKQAMGTWGGPAIRSAAFGRESRFRKY
jgi:hypothetical protein